MFFSAAPLGSKLIKANGWKHSHLGISKTNLGLWKQNFTRDFLLAKRATPILSLAPHLKVLTSPLTALSSTLTASKYRHGLYKPSHGLFFFLRLL
jgi:hypothetical protein